MTVENPSQSLLAHLRALLILGRVSNLPTVWSNCLAGWLLGGAGSIRGLIQLALGATLLYVGGMYLNDAFDVEFDRQHRVERPIPSGAIALDTVWVLGVGWMTGGFVVLAFLGNITAVLALCLVVCIVIYDAVHKVIAFAPVIMALCRFLLYMVAASTGVFSVTGMAMWSGLALGCYIIGLSYIARRESALGPMNQWPCLLLAVPVILAFLVNSGPYQRQALLMSVVVVLWVIRCLRPILWTPTPNLGRGVSGLLAGIALVDLLAVADSPPQLGAVFFLLFVAALLSQRLVPAT
jgi:hypothetical protein